jgi:hypothetical protein
VFVTVTTADTTGEPIEHAAIVAEELDRWLRDADGFVGFMMITRASKAIGLAFWESREAAERHRVARSQFRERILSIAGVRIEEILDYDVAFARFRAGAIGGVGG